MRYLGVYALCGWFFDPGGWSRARRAVRGREPGSWDGDGDGDPGAFSRDIYMGDLVVRIGVWSLGFLTRNIVGVFCYFLGLSLSLRLRLEREFGGERLS